MTAQSSHAPRPLTWIEKYWFGVRLGSLHRLLPGIALAAVVVFLAVALARYGGEAVLRMQGVDPTSPKAKNPLSPMMAAVVLGLVVGNVVRLPAFFASGLDFCTKRLLRLGIICIGIKLSVQDVLGLGLGALPAVLGVVLTGLLVVPLIARLLGVGTNLGLLAAASTSICGVSAALAVAPVVGADEKDTACTVANVTLFGLLAMFVHPWIAHAVFSGDSGAVGLFLGTAVHDTSQVTGAAAVYSQLFGDDRAAKIAIIAKLARNCCLVGVVPLMGWLDARRRGGAAKAARFSTLLPLFVVGFVASACLRSLGDAGLSGGGKALGLCDLAAWKSFVHETGETWATRFLAAAMAAVGLTTSFAKLRSLGPKPFLLGGLAALVVSGAGLGLAALCGRYVG